MFKVFFYAKNMKQETLQTVGFDSGVKSDCMVYPKFGKITVSLIDGGYRHGKETACVDCGAN